MLHSTNASGLATLAKLANTNFDIKVYTQEMLDALQNPLADISKTVEAYQYFTAMYNNQSFTTSSGQVLDFSHLPDSVKKTLHADVTTLIKDYNTITVQGPTGAVNLVNSDGTPATLMDLITNPNGNFSIKFTDDYGHMSGTSTIPGPSWCPDLFSRFAGGENVFSSQYWDTIGLTFGDTQSFTEKDSNGTNLDVSVTGHACSNNTDWTVTTTGSEWEKLGAIFPSGPQPEKAGQDANILEKFLSNNM